MSKLKPILAIETSDELCSAAVMLTEDSYAEINFQKKFVHSEKLMPMISDLLKIADLKLDDVTTLAVSMGPGSFTGLRIGLTVAKGLAAGRALSIIPVPTFDALAFQLSSQLPLGTKFSIANNANINEIYFAKYLVTENRFKVLNETMILEKTKFSSFKEEDDLLFGNFTIEKKDFKTSSPNASAVAKWAYIFGEDLVTFEHDLLEPNYLKKFVVKVKK
jgi:tRNA threonylcarbamoyladenosine biosynthesis protein TsaB